MQCVHLADNSIPNVFQDYAGHTNADRLTSLIQYDDYYDCDYYDYDDYYYLLLFLLLLINNAYL